MDITKKIEYGLRFNYYVVRYAWPILRLLVKKSLSKRCSICTLSEHYVEIQDNICSICRSEKNSTTKKDTIIQDNRIIEKKLDRFLSDSQGKGRGQYDAILFFSGGKDSTYILSQLRNGYQELRILALTIDNGFRSPFGVRNAESVCRHFNVDHIEIRPYGMFNKLYKYAFQNLSHRSFYCVDFWEGELFQDIGRNIAARLKVPLLILGYTPKQIETFSPEYNEYGQYALDDFKPKTNAMFTRNKFLNIHLKDIFTSDEMENWWDSSKYGADEIPETIFPFNAWGYDKKKIEKHVSSLKIVDSANMDPILTNDLYCTLGVYLDYRIFGYCSIEPEWAKLVREGTSDRTLNRNMWELAEYISLNYQNLLLNTPEIQFILNKFGMTNEDIKHIEESSKLKK